MFAAARKFFRLLLTGCASVRSHPPVPPSLEGEVQVPGFPGVRSWGDAPGQAWQESVTGARHQGAALSGKPALKTMDVLVLTGGGDNGAFGAGLLCGWTEHGDRPAFQLITGLSTGALMAPLAFLGPAYDGQLREVYTTISAKNIFTVKNIFSILTSESLTDSQPLANLIARYMTERVLEEVAAQHRKGRRLLAGTTQLDSQRLVIWDLGAIAAAGRPPALALFRQILLASAALPGIFPPVYFQVEAGWQTYQEMHVDGATAAAALTYEYAVRPLATTPRDEADGGRRRLFVIRNGRLRPEWQEVNPQSLAIMPRALATLIKNQSVGDLYRLYYEAQRDGFTYHLAVIPEDFPAAKGGDFDPAYMNRLFQMGYDLARRGYPWAQKPPRL